MSLTSFLDNHAVKDRFRAEFEKPWFTVKKRLLAPPLTDHYSLVGTAFDYLLRFHAERLNRRSVTKPWVAEEAAAVLREVAEKAAALLGEDWHVSRKANAIIRRARENHSTFLRTGRSTEAFLRSTLLLGQLDPFFRAGVLDENLGRVDRRDVTDLRNLISLVPSQMLRAKHVCLLNPTFGEASELVGGADADFVIDDLLMDVKTTKYLEMKRDVFNQLVGYYILYRIGSIEGYPRRHKIKRLGVYFSRYGYLHVMSVADVIREKSLPKFIGWFRRSAREKYAR